MSAQFFGHPESPLFGFYHAGQRRTSSANSTDSEVRAAVICPPIGQEFIRTHWCLRLLGKQLGRKGIDVLRLDYHGLGDSFGTPEQIHSLSDWARDIEQAIDHLKAASGAQTVMLIGQRFGAMLATEVAKLRPDVNSVVLWEPVVCGKDYLAELRSMHAEMLDLWVCSMRTQSDERFEEILGTRYSRSLLNDIEQARLNVDEIIQPQLILDVDSANERFSHSEPSLQKVIIEPDEGRWDDLRVLETARLRPKSTRTIVQMADEMFDRLSCFGALTIGNEQSAASKLEGVQ